MPQKPVWKLSVLLAALLFFPASARAENPGLQTMTYEVYAGGINAVGAKLSVDYDPGDRYTLALTAQTKGFLGKVAPWRGKFETKGWAAAKDGEDGPEQHLSASVWREKEEVKTYAYGKDGSFKGFVEVYGGEKSKDKPDPALTENTTDALTAALVVMKQVAAGGKCEGVSEVFDGKRRFELVFNHEGEEMLQKTRYNAWRGPAIRCTAEVKPMAGHWHEKPRGWMSIQEQGRQKGSMPTVWFAKIDEAGPAIPVKLRVKTDYGTLFMHLVSYNGERHFVADGR